jgi:uncharacterized membrane protein YfcA
MQDILLFGAGIIVGVMNAIAGGGLLLGFPTLLAAGLSPLAANMTGNIVVLPGLLSSAYGYRKYLRTVPRRYILLLIPCFVGGALGAIILRLTPSDRFQELVPGLVLFAVVLFAFQPLIHFRLHRHMRSKSKRPKSLLPLSIALLPMMIYGGYFGAGFGFMMLAFLGFTKLHEIHQMNALKNLAGSVIALVSIACLFSTHRIDWHFGLIMAAGNFAGGYLGARAAQRVSSHAIRIIVIVIGLATATYLGLRTY